jgi:hypothetical protein
MDAGNTVKPVAGVAFADYAQPAAAPGRAAAPTDLPQAKAVGPLPSSSPAQNNAPDPHTPSAAYITRNFVIDPQTRELIYRVMDRRTHQVLWQVPEAALLRSRAYARTLQDGSTPVATKNVTDVTE